MGSFFGAVGTTPLSIAPFLLAPEDFDVKRDGTEIGTVLCFGETDPPE
jgi:hypothetical protein